MHSSAFDQAAMNDRQVAALLQGIANEIQPSQAVERSGTYALSIDDALISLASYILFRAAKIALDHAQLLSYTRIVEQQAKIVSGLIDDGFEPDKAQTYTTSLLKQLAKVGDNDLVYQTITALVRKGSGLK